MSIRKWYYHFSETYIKLVACQGHWTKSPRTQTFTDEHLFLIALTFFFNFLIQLTPWIQYNFCLLESGQCLSPLFCDLKCSTPMVLVLWPRLRDHQEQLWMYEHCPLPLPSSILTKGYHRGFLVPLWLEQKFQDLSVSFSFCKYSHTPSSSLLLHSLCNHHYCLNGQVQQPFVCSRPLVQ